MLEAMLPPGNWSQVSELRGEENAPELFESKEPLWDSWGSVGFERHTAGIETVGDRREEHEGTRLKVEPAAGGGCVFAEAGEALLERQGENWSGKSMLQAHKHNCMIAGVKSFAVIWTTKLDRRDSSHSKSFRRCLKKGLSFQFQTV